MPGTGNARGQTACRLNFVKAHVSITPRMQRTEQVSFCSRGSSDLNAWPQEREQTEAPKRRNGLLMMLASASLGSIFPFGGPPKPTDIYACSRLWPKTGLAATFHFGCFEFGPCQCFSGVLVMPRNLGPSRGPPKHISTHLFENCSWGPSGRASKFSRFQRVPEAGRQGPRARPISDFIQLCRELGNRPSSPEKSSSQAAPGRLDMCCV